MNNILIIGDSCKDIFVYGKIDRICPEAPVPVFNPTHQTENGGMAKNVAANLDTMGASGHLITNANEIIKTRFVDSKTNAMLLRVDENDSTQRIDRDVLMSISDNTYKGETFDALIVSDYCKGYLKEEDIKYIAKNNNNVFLDTKKLLGEWCLDVDFIKINGVEYEKTKDTIDWDKFDDKLIVTLGEKGCMYKGINYPVPKVTSVKDLSGAGDTFLAGLVYKYISNGNDIDKSIEYAQECATKVVQQAGVTTI
tara:strand:+ start:83 stop:841 length:759 start_codon:yes stop_codon:yes gene_type:complete